MKVLFPAIAILLGACASHKDLTRVWPFDQQVGVELRTKRTTYIYEFPHSPQSLWDHTYKYGKTSESGEMQMFEESPKAECPSGSVVKLDRVRETQKFDNPRVIEALGSIECNGSVWEFRYVWGLSREIKAAPWESDTFDPHETRKVPGT